MPGGRSALPGRPGALHAWVARKADAAAVAPRLREAVEAVERGGAAELKRGRRKALYRLRLPPRPGEREPGASTAEAAAAEGPEHLLKVNRYPALAGLRRRLLGSKARRELALAEAASARGVPTPVPLAAAEARRRGAIRTCYLLVEVLPGYADLRAALGEPGMRPAERRALARAFGAFVRRVHDAGLFQDDFAPNNVLVRRGLAPDLLMIDFERARLRRRNGARARLLMLGKIERELAAAPAGERMRFLVAYSGGDRAEARRWWRALERHAPRLARRDRAHLLRAARGGGRRFRALEHGGWRGAALREADRDTLGPVLEAASAGGAEAAAARAGLRCVELSGGRAEAIEALVLATLLAKRGGLAPAPVAAASREGAVRLVLERAAGERPLPEAEDRAAARRAVRVLAARLLGLGRLRAPLAPDRVGLLRGAGGALRARWWPGPELALPGAGEPEAAARAAAIARRLVP